MVWNSQLRWYALTFTLVTCASVAYSSVARGETRTWSNKSGKFSITAELVAIQQGNVVLRTDDGRQLTVPLKQLSAEDQAFVESLEPQKPSRRNASKGHELVELAEQFYNELRSEKREVAGEMLTTKAQEVLKGGKSPLVSLPAPEDGDRAVRVGRPKIDDQVAEIAVQVKAGGKPYKTTLHFRQEEEQWRIFAMSASEPGGTKMFDFETEAKEGASGNDSLEALVGKPFRLVGYTLDGTPLDVSRYQGKVVLVMFWATWDNESRGEMQNVAGEYKKNYNKGFDVIAVSVDQDLEALGKAVAKVRLPWAVVADNFAATMTGNQQQSMAAQYGIQILPAMILVGKDGKVAAVNCRGKKLGEELEKLLAADPAEPAAGKPDAKPAR